MASCGENSGEGSDGFHDFSCTKYNKGNKTSHLCPVCNVFYCVHCLQFLCAHVILGRNEVSRWTVVSASSTCDVDCWRHPGRHIQTYCGEHDDVCCSLCSSRSHRACQTKAIKDVDTSVATENDIQKLQEEIEGVREEIDQLKCNRKSRQSILNQSREDAEKDIRDCCNGLRDKLDNLEMATINDLEATFGTLKGKLQSDIETCEHMENDIARMCHQVNKTKPGCTNSFTRIKRDSEWLKENRMLLSEMGSDRKKDDLRVVLDTTIETTLSGHHCLGKLETNMATRWPSRKKRR